jgi:hypothetical protein
MNSDVKIVFKPGSTCPQYISSEVWEQLDLTKYITITYMNNLWEDTTFISQILNLNPDNMKYKLYRDIYLTDGVKQFMKIILREKNTIESPSSVTITKWIEV